MNYIKESEAYLVCILNALIEHPDALKVKTVAGRRSVIFEIEACPRDLPWLIGRKGRTAEALRELMSSLGGRRGQRFLLEFYEGEPVASRQNAPPEEWREWRPRLAVS